VLGLLVLERALGLFAWAQVVHVAWWQWKRPSRYLFWFFGIWLALPGVGIVLWLAGESAAQGSLDGNDALRWLGSFIGYGALCGAYVMVYPAITDLSPALEILWALHRAGGTLPLAAIDIPSVAGVNSVAHRIANLQSSGLAELEDGSLRLTPSGRRIAGPLDAYRRLLGIERLAGG
jgi:hypothetical protein